MITIAKNEDNPMTGSLVATTDVTPETLRLSKEDWWYPERTSVTSDSTTGNIADGTGATTAPEDVSRYSAPIRKSSLGVKLTGHRVKVLQQWECVVLSVENDYVCCEMHDLTHESNPLEYAEVFVNEFNEFDRGSLGEGTVFYWSIGHVRRSNGQIRRNSEIRIRRMPKLSATQRAAITRKVSHLSELVVDK